MTTAPVRVKLFAGLERRTRQGAAAVDVPAEEARSVGVLAAFLGLPAGAAGLVLVNGLHARPETELSAGDEVSLFPPLGGG